MRKKVKLFTLFQMNNFRPPHPIAEQNYLPLIERRKMSFRDGLVNGIVNKDKNEQRVALLKQHPERRRRVDLDACRAVVDFIDFRVSPTCSIARDQPVKGSDLDGGVVVVNKAVPTSQQQAFVAELREQGFTACTKSEYDRLKQKYEAMTTKEKK
jgi:hypothetical protein